MQANAEAFKRVEKHSKVVLVSHPPKITISQADQTEVAIEQVPTQVPKAFIEILTAVNDKTFSKLQIDSKCT